MSKEMIISVNGREKKIAILDNGRVSEFYIERGDEENSGIVGNIYKGKVMRVLPGMQSAFVEIGLERDAFLYVSDFFDEEEEIERIVMEKSKKGSPEDARREADDQVQRARLEREKQMEAAQEIAEPLATIDAEPISEDETAKDFKDEKRGKSRRDRKGKNERTEAEPFAEVSSDKSGATYSEDFQSEAENSFGGNLFDDAAEKSSEQNEPAEFESGLLFDLDDSGFERVVDDEETTGDMFKDAYRQEAIVDKVRAIEFDMESAATAEVGSLLDSVTRIGGFERIADEDEAEQPSAETKKPKSNRGGRGKGKQTKTGEETNAVKETTKGEETVQAEATKDAEANLGKKSRAKSKKSIEDETIETVRTAANMKPPVSKKKDRGGKKAAKKGGEPLSDAQASVTESEPKAEMAVRRGGRNRRRPNGGSADQERNAQTETDDRNAPPKQEDFEADYPTENNRQSNYRNGGDTRRESSRSDNRNDNRSDNRNDNRGSNRTDNSRTDNNRRERSGSGNTRRERERNQPTITDLLREGQEILVQIAKEPIAKKGARITSHIALPGRFLVYMPTIEHLGVSRKIESASERSRLRVAIQKIRAEEDVPSGGFIVRTAGVGVPEQDLRQDARYLVRTWTDMKKKAEKSKSPALVHQDLDIIQRLLRDQLSDDFSAIRVDSEEEYQRIVEFINRIQPRMVSRVKLYTRETPILEEYAVQEEIDKALKPRVWLKSGGYLVINQTEALVAIDVNTGKFVGKGNARLEDTITKTNMEAVDEIARQIRLRDLGGIIVLDLIDMEDRRNRNKVAQALQEALSGDKSPTKVLSFNDFGLIIMTRKRVKQSLERTLCAPCEYCEGAGWVKSAQTVCFEILEEARRLAKSVEDVRSTTLRVHPEVAKALTGAERMVLEEIEAHLGNVDVTGDKSILHQQQFDFAFI